MSVPMQPDDPVYGMLFDDVVSTLTVYRMGCYICEDPEFAMMGLPLCKPCPKCTKENNDKPAGHVPADDVNCNDCGYDLYEDHKDLLQP